MLSRRNALRGTIFAGLTQAAAAQAPQSGQQTEIAVVAPDNQPTSMQIADSVVARLGAASSHIRAEGSRDVTDAVARLGDRLRPVAAILPSTALAYMVQTGSPSRDVHAHRYIAQLDTLTLQALASRRIKTPRQLTGQRVNLGPRGSLSQISASVLLDQASVRVDPLYLDHEQACAAVIRGDITAMIILAPKPARVFFEVDASDDVHFIPMPEPKGRATGVTAAQILAADYPMIVNRNGGAERGVTTVAVPLVLGCFGWKAESANFIALARLADLLAQRGSGFSGFDMTAAVAGWQRFAPVEDWLARGRSGSIQDYAAAGTRPAPVRQKPAVSNRPAAVAPAEPQQKEKLFQEFLNWRHQR